MSRLIRHEAFVSVDANGAPISVTFSGCTCMVREVLDSWFETGEWWKKKPQKHYFRVLTTQGVLELCHMDASDEVDEDRDAYWILHRKLD